MASRGSAAHAVLPAGRFPAGGVTCAEFIEAFGVLVFRFFIQQQIAQPQVLTQAVFANQNIPMGATLTAEMVTVTAGTKNLETFANHLTAL